MLLSIFWLFLLSVAYYTSAQFLSDTARTDKGSDEQYDEIEDDLIVPHNARDWKGDTDARVKISRSERLRLRLPPMYVDDRSLCYCNYSPEVCGFSNGTCLKYTEAACFRFAEEGYDEDGEYGIHELFGCAPLTRGSGASYFTCEAHLVAHGIPKAINCCYEGNFCNLNLTLPPFLVKQRAANNVLTILLWILITVLVCAAVIVSVFFFTKHFGKKLKSPLRNAVTLAPCSYVEKTPIMCDMSSGSGSGFASLNEKTVAQSLEMIGVIGRGRYGEVKKAYYKGDRIVAVKSFCTKDEESWKNEKEIYQTQMLNHENILQYVAADISSEDSITWLLLITDFHEYGSLYDYLQRDGILSVVEALKLAESAACGLEHLHSKLRGTGTPVKPAIAHRDVKSKNVIVKRRGVCCIADFGLALSEEMVNSEKPINIQVGTKRYMAPEVLSKTLNFKCFFDFKMADVYSFSLVIWEILRRVQECKTLCGDTQGDSGYGSSGNGNKAAGLTRSLVRSDMPILMQDVAKSSSRRPIQPYDDINASDPSLEEMRQIVCVQKIRPVFEDVLKNDEILGEVCAKVEECWDENINVRPTVMGVKRSLFHAISKCKEKKPTSQATGSDYGTLTSYTVSKDVAES